MLDEKLSSLGKRTEHLVDRTVKQNVGELERKLHTFRAAVEDEVTGAAQEVVMRQVSEIKADEQRNTRALSKIMDSRHEALQHQLSEFKKDALAEVDAIRLGVNTVGQAAGVLDSKVGPTSSRWGGKRVAWPSAGSSLSP